MFSFPKTAKFNDWIDIHRYIKNWPAIISNRERNNRTHVNLTESSTSNQNITKNSKVAHGIAEKLVYI